jgi:flagellar biosynthesis protein FlhG
VEESESNNTTGDIDFASKRGRMQAASTIIAVGAGKGGVGKSFISSSLGIFLSQLGYSTVLMDLDLGAANLHTWLGQGLPKRSIQEFLREPSMQLQDLCTQTLWPNLQLISGASEMLLPADVDDFSRARLMSSIFRHQADFIILDLSAGTHLTTLDFFLMAKKHLVVFTPEPSSVENAYRFMKAAFYRKLKRFEYQLLIKEQLDDFLKDPNSSGIRSPGEFVKRVCGSNAVLQHKIQNVVRQIDFQIVLNQARTAQDATLGPAIQSVCNKHFNLDCGLLGCLDYDNAVWQSLRQKHHLLMANRQSHLYAQLMGMARRLANPQPLKAVA